MKVRRIEAILHLRQFRNRSCPVQIYVVLVEFLFRVAEYEASRVQNFSNAFHEPSLRTVGYVPWRPLRQLPTGTYVEPAEYLPLYRYTHTHKTTTYFLVITNIPTAAYFPVRLTSSLQLALPPTSESDASHAVKLLVTILKRSAWSSQFTSD